MNPHEDIGKLAVWARVNLGMLSGEFFALTPDEFFAHFDAWLARDRRERVRFAQICHTVANAMGAKAASGEPLTLAFFLGDKPAAEQAKVKRRSLKQQFIDALPAHYRPAHGHS